MERLGLMGRMGVISGADAVMRRMEDALDKELTSGSSSSVLGDKCNPHLCIMMKLWGAFLRSFGVSYCDTAASDD